MSAVSVSGAEAAPPLVTRAIERSTAVRVEAARHEVEQLLEATYRLATRDGVVNPRVRDILRESGLSTQAFYRHFRSKDDLLLVLLDDGRRRMADYLGHRISKARTPKAQLRAWVEGMLAQAADPQAAARTRPFMVELPRLREAFPAEHAESEAALQALLTDVIRRGKAAGVMRSPSPGDDARVIYLATVAAMERHLLARTSPTPSEANHLVSFALRALRPTA